MFFFSSRRRHTRCSRDWSSDVCSSDLVLERIGQPLVLPVCLLQLMTRLMQAAHLLFQGAELHEEFFFLSLLFVLHSALCAVVIGKTFGQLLDRVPDGTQATRGLLHLGHGCCSPTTVPARYRACVNSF